MVRLLTVLSLAIALPLCSGCEDTREAKCRLWVQRLIKARTRQVEVAHKRVVAFGRYAIPEIEQEFPSATADQKIRLLEALGGIADKEAIPLLIIISERDPNSDVRERAKRIAKKLTKPTA